MKKETELLFLDIPRSFWIGLRLADSSTPELRWVNGAPLNYTNWNGEVEIQGFTSGDETCAVMGHPCCAVNLTNYAWFSVDCSNSFLSQDPPSYICQRPKGRHSVNFSSSKMYNALN